MPMPNEYQRAGQIFEQFLEDARGFLDHATRNQTYTTVQAVFLVFRRRLSVEQGLRFADELPAVLRALFIKDWDLSQPTAAFAGFEEMADEVCSLRRHHNFAPPTAIREVAKALRCHVDNEAFDAVLATLPDGAADYWSEGDQ
ncbi:MAG: DUF2267 domain-containing protein [Rhodobacteraceae bacterium]|nr:DUF2267 domain-containing protein [Paracoccaceae bacterium]